MTQISDTDIRDLKQSIEANTKAIADLTLEIRLGFANVDTKFAALDGKFDKLDERTKLGFWGFILRGIVLAAIIGVGGYLLPIVAAYVGKLPNL
jgi:hypothetical protein